MFPKSILPARSEIGNPIRLSERPTLLICTMVILGFSIQSITPSKGQTMDNLPVDYFHEPLPGLEQVDPQLAMQFAAQRKKRGVPYKPRTRHLRPDGWARYTNRLFLQSSPYLLQHAHNPINWYPWGDEAFAAAKARNIPVMLSIGYSTCHWCHVMEEESFEDVEIAAYLNENFIAIKVDREARPDVDAIYMSAVQTMTGRGGWPLNVWLTPDREPFFGGTYYPPRDGERGNSMGLLTLLKRIKSVYDTEPGRVAEATELITRAVSDAAAPPPGSQMPTAAVLHQAAAAYKERYDPKFGGLRGAPKFPSSLPVPFLLRYGRRSEDPAYLRMAAESLEKMALGGLYDQVGGGFHRYATDEKWRVPHFEKMLYDNALLVPAYLEAYQLTGRPLFRRIVTETLRYVSREMTSPEGAFFTATDADSLTPDGHREEGYYFTWTPAELETVLGSEMAAVVGRYFGVTPQGNFEGRTIPHIPASPAAVAREFSLSEADLAETIHKSRDLLYQSRGNRPPPLRDEKILTGWNGLMISALAQAGLILHNRDYVRQAAAAATFILKNLHDSGSLKRSYADGRAGGSGYLNDYALMIAGLLDLYEASQNPEWLHHAIALEVVAAEAFEDKSDGGFYMTGKAHEDLLARQKPHWDGAMPSGNSVMVLNLLRLGEYTSRKNYHRRATRTLTFFGKVLESQPTALSSMLTALDYYLDTPKEIVIISPQNDEISAGPLLEAVRKTFVPNRMISLVTVGAPQEALGRVVPLVRGKAVMEDKPTAYVCIHGSCELPTTDPRILTQQLGKIEPYGP